MSHFNSDCPLVSIVVPVFNKETMLTNCVESLLNQTYENIEIILVDDASSDGSRRLIDGYASKYESITGISNSVNKGLLLTRQVGIAIAQGEYLLNVDADDFVDPETVANCVELAKNNMADIVQFGMRKVRNGMIEPHEVSISQLACSSDDTPFREFLLGKINFSVCNKMYRLSLWRSASVNFPKKNQRVEDLSQNLFLFYQSERYVSTNEIFYNYVITENSDSRSNSISDFAERAKSSVRHLCKLKLVLGTDYKEYKKEVDDLEKSVYHNYVRPFVQRARMKKYKAIDETIVVNTIRYIHKLNGFLPLDQYLHLDEFDARSSAFRGNSHSRKFVPVVSVVMPAYNVEDYIDESIESVLKQSYRSFELIVVDDGSNDRTADIVKRYQIKNSKIRLIEHETNKGLLQARLTGVRQAKGKYITHIDSDDWYDREFLFDMVTAIERNRSDIVSCGYTEHLQNKKSFKKLCNSIDAKRDKDCFRTFLNVKYGNAMWNKIVRREVWDAVLGYMPTTNYKAEDLLQNMHLYFFCRHSFHHPRSLYNYRVRENSGDRVMDKSSVFARAVSACFIMNRMSYLVSYTNADFTKEFADRLNGYFTNAVRPLFKVETGSDGEVVQCLSECTKWMPLDVILNVYSEKKFTDGIVDIEVSSASDQQQPCESSRMKELVNEAKEMLQVGEFIEAKEILEPIVKEKPSSIAAFYLARILFEEKEFNESVVHVDNFLSIAPNHKPALQFRQNALNMIN